MFSILFILLFFLLFFILLFFMFFFIFFYLFFNIFHAVFFQFTWIFRIIMPRIKVERLVPTSVNTFNGLFNAIAALSASNFLVDLCLNEKETKRVKSYVFKKGMISIKFQTCMRSL